MEPHLTEEELLSLVDQSYDDGEESRLYGHLLQCDDCLADLRYMTRDRVFTSPDRLSKKERRTLIDSGMSLAENMRPSASATRIDAPAQHDRRPHRQIYGFAVLVTALVAIVAAAWIWQSNTPEPESNLVAEVTDPILMAMASFSDEGDVVMPRTEDMIKQTTGNYRGGAAEDEDVSAALIALSKRFGDGDHSRDLLFWLIGGYISNRDFRSAVQAAQVAREEYPGDAEIATLAALAAFYSDDFDEAERLLRYAVAREGGTDVAALNLGVVLLATGKREDAREILRTVSESHPNTPLGKRADTVLESDL